MTFFADVAGTSVRVVGRPSRAGGIALEIDGALREAALSPGDAVAPEAARGRDVAGVVDFVLELDGRRERVVALVDGDVVHVHARGRAFAVRIESELERLRARARARSGSGAALAPMPGVVVEHLVREGETVAAGQALLVIESMKLQSRIASEVAGRVAALPCEPGSAFERGAVLARIEPADARAAVAREGEGEAAGGPAARAGGSR